jgi:hypothetical protein
VTSIKSNIVNYIVLNLPTKLYIVDSLFVDFVDVFGKSVLVSYDWDFRDFGDPGRSNGGR